jgi:hypothetical protein
MNLRKTSIILLVLLLAAMAMVPIVSAANDSTDRAQFDAMQKKWQEEHKVRVMHTTTATYNDGIFEIVDTYV